MSPRAQKKMLSLLPQGVGGGGGRVPFQHSRVAIVNGVEGLRSWMSLLDVLPPPALTLCSQGSVDTKILANPSVGLLYHHSHLYTHIKARNNPAQSLGNIFEHYCIVWKHKCPQKRKEDASLPT